MLNEMVPPNAQRVKLHTRREVNEKICHETMANVSQYANKSREDIDRRIQELDKEWDTERVLEANAATLILISTVLGFLFSPLWFTLVGVIAFFLLQHALQGWCPPLPIIRRLGIRTASEIDAEKTALRALRGDFESPPEEPEELLIRAGLT